MGETRINLKHLLEDIRDAYPFIQEEAIITELIANALDSGASQIHFSTNNINHALSIIDNGKGMSAKEFEEYHDIAATTKVRGKGIGFAGVGVKLALLIAKKVITETRSKNFHAATSWHLENPQKAPWEYIEQPPGLVETPNGTAVSIILPSNSSLLDTSFLENVIQKHFYPILDQEFMEKILKYIYEDNVVFFVNDKRIKLPETEGVDKDKLFLVQVGRKSKPVGIGFIRKSKETLPEEERGIAIATYGKVIKRGWDWVGVMPRNPAQITRIIEIPQLSEILTTNKADFLKDAASLQKYYRFRKAAQEGMEPILKELGEIIGSRERPEKDLRPLEKEIERVLENMLNNFPELSPLLGRRRKAEPVTGIISDPESSEIGVLTQGVDIMTGTQGGSGEGAGIENSAGELPGERIEPSLEKKETGKEYEGHRKRPGLMLGFEDNEDRKELGWLSESTVWINKGHPAYKRVMNNEGEN